MQPVIQFLETAAKADAVRTVKSGIRSVYDENLANIQNLGPYERVEEVMLRDVESAPSQAAITRDFYLAWSAAPTAKWFVPLFVVWSWVGQTEGGSAEKLRNAIQKVRNLVEDWSQRLLSAEDNLAHQTKKAKNHRTPGGAAAYWSDELSPQAEGGDEESPGGDARAGRK